jgi:hypothetical protein
MAVKLHLMVVNAEHPGYSNIRACCTADDDLDAAKCRWFAALGGTVVHGVLADAGAAARYRKLALVVPLPAS